MIRTSTPTKIALSQVFLLLGVLACAKTLGFLPDQDERIMAGRVAVCEAAAMHTAELVGQEDIKRLKSTLIRVVDRSPGMLSAGVRRRNGSLVARTADHQERWNPLANDQSNDVQFQVPIRIGQQRWGSIEYCFEPLAYTGKHAWILNPWMLHSVFVLAGSYVAFTLYLGRRLDRTVLPEAISRPGSEMLPADKSTTEEFDLSVALRRAPSDHESVHRRTEGRDSRTDVRWGSSESGRSVPSYDSQAITSSFPADDPAFREIVCGFVEILGAKILELHAAWDRRDLDEVARLAHWIKGSGGTVGFDDFTQPSTKLQEVAQQGELAEVEAVIAQIIGLYQRINVSSIDALRENAWA